MTLTHERLLEVLHYDPETGVFTWKVTRGGSAVVGDVAGSINSKGYWRVMIDKKVYRAHRLAWFYIKGEWPSKGLDHKDRNKTHNWIENLREATPVQNMGNHLGKSVSGFKGVRYHKGKYESSIFIRGKSCHLGRFSTPEEAHEVYCGAAKDRYGEFACTFHKDMS